MSPVAETGVDKWPQDLVIEFTKLFGSLARQDVEETKRHPFHQLTLPPGRIELASSSSFSLVLVMVCGRHGCSCFLTLASSGQGSVDIGNKSSSFKPRTNRMDTSVPSLTDAPCGEDQGERRAAFETGPLHTATSTSGSQTFLCSSD